VTIQSYWYNPPISNQQPWTWTQGLGGIALTGSPWDPPPPVIPPSGPQYAFLQTSPNGATGNQSTTMSTTVTGLTAGASYVLRFYWGTRSASGGYQTQSTLIVSVNNAAIWTSPSNIADATGWQTASSTAFTPSSTSLSLLFSVTSTSNNDHAVLIDGLSFSRVSSTGTTIVPPGISSSGTNITPGGSSNNSNSHGLSGGAVAGIVIGVVVGVVLCIIVLICCVAAGRRNKGHTKHQDEKEESQVTTHDESHDTQHQTEGETGVELA